MLIRTQQTGGAGAELVFDLELCSIGICPVSNCLDGIFLRRGGAGICNPPSCRDRGLAGLRACAAALVETELA